MGAHAAWTSAATHAVLPLVATDAGVRLQVETGIASHRERFGAWRGGFWLPECAHEPWLDPLLEEAGVHAVCAELTDVLGLGDPRHLTPLRTGDGPLVVLFSTYCRFTAMRSVGITPPVRGVGRRKIQAALALGASRSMIFRRVIFPASLPGIFTSIRVGIGLGVTMLVGAEMIATTAGIAWMAMSASDFLLTNVVIVGALIMALLGYVLDLLARALEDRVVHWGGKEG